ncbi:MAG: GGDEF domain-containing protein [Eubacterium sp.]|nr:GGDEF domain-containing protein [Eubacterium sp.]
MTSMYSSAINSYIFKMANIHDADSMEAREAMSELCEMFGIAHIEYVFYETMLDRKLNKGSISVIYNKGNFNIDRARSIADMTDVGNPVVYTVVPYTDVPEWDDDTYENIKAFIKTVHIFRGRIRTMQLAEQYMFRDSELGVYNLQFFLRCVGRMISENKVSEYNTCRFNMQRFSSVNLQLGRRKGTELLRRYINMLQTKLGQDGFVCRLGGDNFVVLYKKEYQETVESHVSGVEIVFDEFTGEAMMLSAYAGFYMITAEDRTPSEIMDNVSAAAAEAKSNRANPRVFYNEKLVHMQEHKKLIESLFPAAMDNEEFLVYYQPKIDLRTYDLVGAEALCRWRHDGEIIPPDSFIPILEQSTAVCKLDFYMLEHVCADIRNWIDEGRQIVKVSVNLSRRHLGSSTLLESILRIIDHYDIPHEYIEIELTETTTDVDFTDLKEIVSGLKRAGISTSVDDFGVGYSSMNLIRDLPWNVLKIDKSFLPDADESDPKHFTMLKYLIAMAQEMGLECIVEGVETQDQVNLLKKDGCYLAQGFFFDRPLPVDVFVERLKKK